MSNNQTNYRLAVVGGGNMGAALVGGLIAGGWSAEDLAVVALDRDDAAVRQVGDDQILPERDPARLRLVPLVLHARVGHPDTRLDPSEA